MFGEGILEAVWRDIVKASDHSCFKQTRQAPEPTLPPGSTSPRTFMSARKNSCYFPFTTNILHEALHLRRVDVAYRTFLFNQMLALRFVLLTSLMTVERALLLTFRAGNCLLPCATLENSFEDIPTLNIFLVPTRALNSTLPTTLQILQDILSLTNWLVFANANHRASDSFIMESIRDSFRRIAVPDIHGRN